MVSLSRCRAGSSFAPVTADSGSRQTRNTRSRSRRLEHADVEPSHLGDSYPACLFQVTRQGIGALTLEHPLQDRVERRRCRPGHTQDARPDRPLRIAGLWMRLSGVRLITGVPLVLARRAVPRWIWALRVKTPTIPGFKRPGDGPPSCATSSCSASPRTGHPYWPRRRCHVVPSSGFIALQQTASNHR